MEQWSKEKAWAWYNAKPWIRGFNYVASDCVNRQEQWQDYEHDKKELTFERELALAAEYGFNAVRTILPFEPWYYECDKFAKHLENYLNIANKNGIGVMIVFGNDCTVPKEIYEPPVFGPQNVDMGYHGGVIRSPHKTVDAIGYSLLDEPELCRAWTEMVGEIVGRYAKDERVEIWDIFNEIGASRRGGRSVKYMEGFFETARSKDPIQPLTACAWTVEPDKEAPIRDYELRAVELSDIVSYHDYRPYDISVRIIDVLKKFDRPIINSEWLHRIKGNTVDTQLPLFYLEKIGCYNWGFVAGKTQTYEPWEIIWQEYYAGKGAHYDFTKWQHDLFRPNLRPYDPREMELFKKYAAFDEARFKSNR